MIGEASLKQKQVKRQYAFLEFVTTAETHVHMRIINKVNHIHVYLIHRIKPLKGTTALTICTYFRHAVSQMSK